MLAHSIAAQTKRALWPAARACDPLRRAGQGRDLRLGQTGHLCGHGLCARLCEAIEAQRPGFVAVETIEPSRPVAFVAAIVRALRRARSLHLQLPIEGWGNSVVPGLGAVRGAPADASRPHRDHPARMDLAQLLRYLSLIPDLLAADGFVFVSPRQREAFLRTPWSRAPKKARAPVIPIGPNIMPARIDPLRVAARARALMRRRRARARTSSSASFGVLYASKRPDLLLRVVRALARRGVKARLLVCGDFLWDKPNDRTAFLASRTSWASPIGSTSAAGSTTRAN